MPAKSGLLMHSEGSGSSGGLSGVSEMKRDGNPSEDPKSRHTNISAEQAKAFTGYYLFIFCFLCIPLFICPSSRPTAPIIEGKNQIMLELRLIFYSILMRQMQADKQTTAPRTHMARSPWPQTGPVLCEHVAWVGGSGDPGAGEWEIITAMAHKGVALD